MDDARETGFCMFCGEKFLTKEEVQRVLVQHSGNVELSRKTEIDNLLIRLEEKANILISSDQISVTEYLEECHILETSYIDKILDIDAKNQDAIQIKNKLDDTYNLRIAKDKNDKEKHEKAAAEYDRKKRNEALLALVIVVILTFIVCMFMFYKP